MTTWMMKAALGAGALALIATPVSSAPEKRSRAQEQAQRKSSKAPADADARRKPEAIPAASPASATGITYALKDIIKAKGGEFCAPYGEENCIQEVEICLAMVDRDGDPVRLCVNSTPEEKSDAQPRTARFRQ